MHHVTYCPITTVARGERVFCDRSTLFHHEHRGSAHGVHWYWADSRRSPTEGEFVALSWLQEMRARLHEEVTPAEAA